MVSLRAGILSSLLCIVGCGQPSEPSERASAEAVAPQRPSVVRVAAVNTTLSSGLLPSLVADFEAQSGYTVEFVAADNVEEGKKGRGKSLLARARAGEVDLVIAHYGKPALKSFVSEGAGAFPQLVFANQAALLGPASDPAGVAGLDDAAEAFARIASTGSAYYDNDMPGARNLTQVLWHAAGRPEKGDWYIDGDKGKGKAVTEAATRGAYILFGAQPFLHHADKHGVDLQMHVVADPLLQRSMAAVVVEPSTVPGVNAEGAKALQRYLLTPSVQAQVRAFRQPGVDVQLWWPMARHNDPAELIATPS